MVLFPASPTPIVYLTTLNGKAIYLKQDYLNHPAVSGNKLRKLKYTLQIAQENQATLISFGGAYSNHIAALAAAGNILGISTVGIIRGQELADTSRWSNTLKKAADNRMQLHFISRETYREKQLTHAAIKAIIDHYANAKIIPEGGSDRLSLIGSAEIIDECIAQHPADGFDVLFAACGTGGTLAGLIDGVARQTSSHYRLVGISVLKGHLGLSENIRSLSRSHMLVDWSINQDYHFGGYAKTSPMLQAFMADFESNYKIPLDPIYTAKLCYAVFDLANNSPNKQPENWLIYHSGGLQGAK